MLGYIMCLVIEVEHDLSIRLAMGVVTNSVQIVKNTVFINVLGGGL